MTILMQYNPAILAPFNPPVSLNGQSNLPRYIVAERATAPRQSDLYRLLSQHLALVRRVCDRFKDCGEPVEDLALAGLGGLLEAVAAYDANSGRGFVVFAMPVIVGAITDYFRDKGWATRVPGQLVTQNAVVGRVLESFEQKFDRSPTIPEIVDATGLSAEMVLQTMEGRIS